MSRASGSSRCVKRAARSGRRTRRHGIDFSDLPEMSDEQLRSMQRVGRPSLGPVARQLIAIRIDPRVLVALQREAKRQEVRCAKAQRLGGRASRNLKVSNHL